MDAGEEGTGADSGEESTGTDPGDFFLNEMHDHWKIPDRQTDRQMQPLGRLLLVATLSRVLAAKMDQ